MNFRTLTKARKILDSLWKKAWLRGRCCWGVKLEDKNNPYLGPNITLAIGNELVSISQDPDGSLKIHEFSKTRDTDLGKKIKEVLTKESIKFKEEKE
jgi:hypothetical protein